MSSIKKRRKIHLPYSAACSVTNRGMQDEVLNVPRGPLRQDFYIKGYVQGLLLVPTLHYSADDGENSNRTNPPPTPKHIHTYRSWYDLCCRLITGMHWLIYVQSQLKRTFVWSISTWWRFSISTGDLSASLSLPIDSFIRVQNVQKGLAWLAVAEGAPVFSAPARNERGLNIVHNVLWLQTYWLRWYLLQSVQCSFQRKMTLRLF